MGPTIEGITDLVEVGRGGFGVVFKGWQTAFDRHVAVKVLATAPGSDSLRLFAREARAMGRVSGHPHPRCSSGGHVHGGPAISRDAVGGGRVPAPAA